MHVIRLVGMPDKVIAFDGLPEELVAGLDMQGPHGFPRHWKAWLGTKKKITKINPERDPITMQIRTFEPIVEEGPFFYIVDEMMNQDVEKWQAICDYARRNAPLDFRLKDKIEDMAKPLAADPKSELKLEPEEVVVIPLGKKLIVPDVPAPIVVPEIKSVPSEAEKVAMQNNANFKTLGPKDVQAMKHDASCKTFGRAGRYSDGCQKCELLKLNRQPTPA